MTLAAPARCSSSPSPARPRRRRADAIRRLDVSLVLDPGLRASSPYRDEAVAEARRRGASVDRAREALRVGALRVRCCGPRTRRAGRRPEPPGDRRTSSPTAPPTSSSRLMRRARGRCRFGRCRSRSSRSSTTARPTRASTSSCVSPVRGSALVSVGEDNDYGHPRRRPSPPRRCRRPRRPTDRSERQRHGRVRRPFPARPGGAMATQRAGGGRRSEAGSACGLRLRLAVLGVKPPPIQAFGPCTGHAAGR